MTNEPTEIKAELIEAELAEIKKTDPLEVLEMLMRRLPRDIEYDDFTPTLYATIRQALAEAKALKQRVEGSPKVWAVFSPEIHCTGKDGVRTGVVNPSRLNSVFETEEDAEADLRDSMPGCGCEWKDHGWFKREIYAVPVEQAFDPAQDEREHLERVRATTERP